MQPRYFAEMAMGFKQGIIIHLLNENKCMGRGRIVNALLLCFENVFQTGHSCIYRIDNLNLRVCFS